MIDTGTFDEVIATVEDTLMLRSLISRYVDVTPEAPPEGTTLTPDDATTRAFLAGCLNGFMLLMLGLVDEEAPEPDVVAPLVHAALVRLAGAERARRAE